MKPEAFDIVIGRGLHRTPDARKALESILPTLRPGGYVVCGLSRRTGIDEVLSWFRDNDVEFLRGVPSVQPTGMLDPAVPLFAPEPRGSRLAHWVTQVKWVLTNVRAFDMIGRKRSR